MIRPDVVTAFNLFIPNGAKCLEIGPGLDSTPLLRELVEERDGFVLSIEDKKEWYTKIKEACPDSKFGKIILSPIVAKTKAKAKAKAPVFEYKLKDMYDIVFIDGPNGGSILVGGKKKLIGDLFWFKQASERVDLKWKRKLGRGGFQSMFVIDNVWKNIKVGGYIIIDNRLFTAMYCLRTFNVQHIAVGDLISKRKYLAVFRNAPDAHALSAACNVFKKLE